MKKLITILALVLLGAAPAMAGASLSFASSSTPAWAASYVSAGNYSMTFMNNAVRVGNDGSGDAVIGDFLNLPSMTITNIGFDGTTLVADILAPAGYLTISDNGIDAVFEASLSSGTIEIKKNSNGWNAYSYLSWDVTTVSYNSAYGSDVLQDFADASADGIAIDLDFNGQNAIALYNLLNGGTGAVNSTTNSMSGSMTVVPAPGAVLLGGIGVSFIGWLKRRRSL